MGTENEAANDSAPVERMYSYEEVAQILRISRRTVRAYAYDDQVPRYQHVSRNRRTRYVPESVVREWLRRQYVNRTPNRTMVEASQTA